MDQLSQKYMDSVKLIKQSEFKKPYLEDDYVGMEYSYNPPDWPGYAPPTPGDSVIPDCRVGFEAGGILKDWRECDPGNSCAAYIFTCAHKLTAIMCGNCVISEMTPLEGDRLQIIICSDRDSLDIKYQSSENPSEPSKWKSFEEERICCLKETISIGYTSQQMSCDGTQVLTVIPSGGNNDCYSWAVSGGGTLDLYVGNAVTYTAPSSNPECANNPTITLTAKLPGGGTQTATLKLAVNCAGAGGNASIHVWYWAEWAQIYTQYHNCEGTAGGSAACCGGSNYPAQCDPLCCCGSSTCQGSSPCTEVALGCDCSTRYVDIRSAAMKTAGCCPAQLL